MFHICFAADENYIKYTAVLITSIVKSTDISRKFADFFSNNANGGGDFDIRNSARNDGVEADSPRNLNTQKAQIYSSLKNYKKLNFHTLSEDERREGYVFHILSDFVSENSREKLANLAKKLSEIYPCDIKIHILENVPQDANFPACHRLFIPNFMPPNLRLCVYLDGDMLAFADLRELFTLDLGDKAVGAVRENAWLVRQNSKRMGLFGDFYFNSGFLLMNLVEFRSQNILEKCLNFITRYKGKTLWIDQDALNFAIGKNKTLVMPLNFNLFVNTFRNAISCDERRKFSLNYTRKELNHALLRPAIVHYVGSKKPWDELQNSVDATNTALAAYWWEMALQVPIFRDEFEPLFAKAREKHFADKDFRDFVAFSLLRNSTSLFGYLKMPFIVCKLFKNRAIDKNLVAQIPKFSPNENNLAYELFSIASKAWENRHKLRLLDLPHRVWRMKNRVQKYGIERVLR